MKNAEIKVSLVITVYNRIDTLARCIESAIQQTLNGLEIVVVDDCSTDQSVELVEKYMRRHRNITLVRCPKNGGVGYAKNMGVKAAHGEYISFLDSDDYLDPDYLENLYSAIKKTGSDIAVADICIEGSSSTICRISEENLVIKVKGLSRFPLDKPSIVPGIVVAGFGAAASCCTKLVRREKWVQFPFHEGRRCDDLSATLPLLALSKQIVYVPQCVYHYVESNDSMERLEFSVESQLAATEGLRQYLIKRKKYEIPVEYEYIFTAISVFAVLAGLFEAKDLLEHTDCVEQAYRLLYDVIDPEAFSESTNPYLAEQSKVQIAPERRLTMSLFPLFAEGKIQELTHKLFQWRRFDKEFSPKVSVIIPVYNGANYMREAIDSALNQTYENIEIIVVNDGSRDGGETDKIARSYGNKIRYFKKENGGVATALNLGIEKMTGEYFSWLSHDDMYLPSKIEEELRWLSIQQDKTTVIAEGYQIVNAAGEYQYTINLNQLYPSDRLENSMFLVMRGGINGCSLLIHKSHFNRVGLFDPSLPTTQDYDLWFRMFRGQQVCYLKSSNVLSRSHDEQGSKALLSTHVEECETLWIRMMDTLTLEEKETMSGSEYVFYQEMWEFLKSSTGYHKAIKYAQYKMHRATMDEFERSGSSKALKAVCDYTGYRKDDLLNIILPLRNAKKPKARIMFYLAGRYEWGGQNRVVLQVAGLLAERYDVIVTTSQEPTGRGYPTPAGVTEIKIPWKPHENGAIKLGYLAYILRADILVNSYNCVESQLKIYEVAQFFGIRTIAWNHEFYFLPYWNTSLQECIPRRNDYFKAADAVVWVSKFSASLCACRCGHTAYMPNPASFEIAAPRSLPNSRTVLAVGRFGDPVKRIDRIIEVFGRLHEKMPDATLVLLGKCPDLYEHISEPVNKSVYSALKNVGLTPEDVVFAGEQADVRPYYAQASILLLASEYEGFPLVLAEAGAYGVPAVVYGTPGLNDIIIDDKNGYVVEKNQPDLAAEHLYTLLQDSELWLRMSQNAQSLVQRFSPENIRIRWEQLLQTVLESSEKLNEGKPCDTIFLDVPPISHDVFCNTIDEYERCISSLLVKISTIQPVAVMAASPTELQWQAECGRMQQSLSWRITKPLRLIKKSVVVLKSEGLKVFLLKVRRKLFHQ